MDSKLRSRALAAPRPNPMSFSNEPFYKTNFHTSKFAVNLLMVVRFIYLAEHDSVGACACFMPGGDSKRNLYTYTYWDLGSENDITIEEHRTPRALHAHYAPQYYYTDIHSRGSCNNAPSRTLATGTRLTATTGLTSALCHDARMADLTSGR